MPKTEPSENREIRALLVSLGFTKEFAFVVTSMLDTPFVAHRMLRHLRNARPRSETAVADELVAILEERAKYVQKHIDRGY